MTTKDAASLHSVAWPASRVGEAIELLGRKAGFVSKLADIPLPPEGLIESDERLAQWIEQVAKGLGLEAQHIHSPYNDVLKMVRRAGPALLRLPGEGEPYFLALLKGGRWKVKILTPEFKVRRLSPDLIRTVLTQHIEAPAAAQIELLLAASAVPEERREEAKKGILREQLRGVQIEGCWLLHLSLGSSFWLQMRQAGLSRQIRLMIGAYLIQQLFVVGSGWMIIQGSFEGYLQKGWLVAWGFLVFSTILFQFLVLKSQGALASGVGGLFKKRLLYGALQLNPEEVRHQGAGQFLGRVMESEAVESLALGGGFAAMISLIQLLTAASVLTFGTGGGFHALLLFLWVMVTLLMGWRYYRRSQLWVESYREMTNDLVERMVGHRTRLAQEDFEHWHDDEDQILQNYLSLSGRMDSISIQLNAFIKRGWLILGLAGLTATFINSPTSSIELAITLGGIILASTAFDSLVNGMTSVVEIMNAWEQFAPLFQAASRAKENQSSNAFLFPPEDSSLENQPIILARQLTFSYREGNTPVIVDCNLQVRQGERLLLEGPSGGGKSTLAALLAGLRVPQSGLLLLQGLDIKSMGIEAWRQRVVSAPQFHENHILTETLAFNLLMGRDWPPTPEDLREAERLCYELGLGDLLERMPSGIQQIVGESGWQLSHGEQSRLYIARALLQKAELIILDESFAALDPENLHRALECVLRRAKTLLVIAHP